MILEQQVEDFITELLKQACEMPYEGGWLFLRGKMPPFERSRTPEEEEDLKKLYDEVRRLESRFCPVKRSKDR